MIGTANNSQCQPGSRSQRCQPGSPPPIYRGTDSNSPRRKLSEYVCVDEARRDVKVRSQQTAKPRRIKDGA